MPAMAGSAAHFNTGVLDLVHVIVVDVLHHRDHHPRRLLLRLRIESKIKPRMPVWSRRSIGIRRMTGAAMCAQRTRPCFHDLVNLLACQVLWQHLQVLRRRKVEMAYDSGFLRRQRRRRHRLRGLRNCGYGEDGCSKHGNRGGSIRERCLQLRIFLGMGMNVPFPQILSKRRPLRRQSFASRYTFMPRK